MPRDRTEKRAFLLRIDSEIYEALQLWADDELRSVNGHLEFLLRDALRRAGRLPRSRPRSTGVQDRRASGRDEPTA
jgi:hypothetical protein